MKKITTTLLLTFCLSVVFAQDTTDPKQMVTIGLSGGKAANLNLFSIPITYHHQLMHVKGLYYTLGLRQNLAFGEREFNINGQETLIDDISNYSINAFAGIEYHYQKSFIGFNIDLIGLNIGTRSYKTVGTDPVYTITPENLNLAGVSGCSNNEFYLGYQFTSSVAAQIGISYYNMSLLYANQTTPETSAYVGTLLPMVKVDYTLWQR